MKRPREVDARDHLALEADRIHNRSLGGGGVRTADRRTASEQAGRRHRAHFGPLVGCAGVALYRVLAWQRETIAGLLAAIANVAAGALVVAMFLVQIGLSVAAEQAPGLDASNERILDHIHFGLDLSWDTFICLGAFLFGLVMVRRRGFGPVVGGAGMVIAVALYAVNFATFPSLPARARSTWDRFSGTRSFGRSSFGDPSSSSPKKQTDPKAANDYSDETGRVMELDNRKGTRFSTFVELLVASDRCPRRRSRVVS